MSKSQLDGDVSGPAIRPAGFARLLPLAPLLVTICIAAVTYAPMLASGSADWQDVNDWPHGLFRFQWVRTSLFSYGQFPLRCHFVGGGYPTIGNPQDPTLNPLTWVLLPFSTMTALKLQFFIMAILAAGGTYLLARRALHMTTWGACYAALMFSVSSWMPWQVSGGTINEFYPALVPLCLCLLLPDAPRRAWRFLLVPPLMYAMLADGKGQIILAVIFLGLVCLTWWLQCRTKYWLPLVLIPLALFFAVFIGALKIVPTLEFLWGRGGGAFDLKVVGHGEQTAHSSLEYFCRNLVGFQGRSELLGVAYVGLLPVLLALAGLFFAGRRLLAFAITTLLFSWLVIGENAPFDLLAQFVRLPFCNVLDQPAKYLAPYIILSIALGGAACFGPLTHGRMGWGRRVLAIAVIGGAILPLIPAAVQLSTESLTEPARAPIGERPADFYCVAAAADFQKDPKEIDAYYNLLRYVGTLAWDTALPIPTAVQPRYFIEQDGSPTPNPDYHGEAYLEGGRGSCSAIFKPNSIVATVELQQPDLLVLNQNFHQGWRADRGSVQSTGGLLSVRLDRPGRHLVSLRYHCAPFTAGLVISLAGVACLAVFVSLWASGRIPFLDQYADSGSLFSSAEEKQSQLKSGIVALCLVAGVALPNAGIGFVDGSAVRLAKQGRILCSEGNLDKAIELFEQAQAVDPYNSRVLAPLAMREMAFSKYDRAVEYLTRCLREFPREPTYRYSRAVAFIYQEDYERALQDLSDVIELAPSFAGAHLNRGDVYLRIGQPGLALADLQRAVALDPTKVAAYFLRGRAFAEQGQLREARADWQRAVDLEPEGEVGEAARRLLEQTAPQGALR